MPLGGEVRQILSALCVNLLSCSLGAAIGWASSALNFLESSESDLTTGTLTPAESGLINSMFPAGGLVGSMLYGFVCDKIGRKNALHTVSAWQLIGLALVAYGETSMTILLSRFFIGLSAGALYICIPFFVSEIAEDQMRGGLGSFLVLLTGYGLLIGYVFGSLMRYDHCVWIYVGITCAYGIGQFFIHETPYHLMKTNKFERASDSMKFYRGVKEMNDNVAIELESLKKFVTLFDVDEKVTLSDFLTKAARKSILIGLVLVWLEQFCGVYAILFYTASIFEESHATAISPDNGTIIVGVIQLMGCHCSAFLIDRVGRKKLIVGSAAGIAIGHIIFGTVSIAIENNNGDVSDFVKLIPVISLSLSVFMASGGVFPLALIILAEITPSNVKSHIFTFCMMLSWVFTFAVFQLLPILTYEIGLGSLMFVFAVCSVLGGVFMLIYLPETMGKSFEEIAEIMQS